MDLMACDAVEKIDEQTKAKSALAVHPFDHGGSGENQPICFENGVLRNEFKNHKVISTTLDDDSISLKDFKAPSDYILIFGNEGRGINREIIDSSDYKLKIDMNDIDSLNVALSMAIISYKLSEW